MLVCYRTQYFVYPPPPPRIGYCTVQYVKCGIVECTGYRVHNLKYFCVSGQVKWRLHFCILASFCVTVVYFCLTSPCDLDFEDYRIPGTFVYPRVFTAFSASSVGRVKFKIHSLLAVASVCHNGVRGHLVSEPCVTLCRVRRMVYPFEVVARDSFNANDYRRRPTRASLTSCL